MRLGLGLNYEYNNWQAKVFAMYNAKQKRIHNNDLASLSYTNVSLSLEHNMKTSYGKLLWFIKGDNLLNKDIRPASDFLHNIAPYGKRSVKVGLNLNF